MKASVKKKWLKALRSGEYRKARGRLHNHRKGTYCCLGVLREVASLSDPLSNASLTHPSLRQVGLSAAEENELVSLNDRLGGWDAVCDYIEAKL